MKKRIYIKLEEWNKNKLGKKTYFKKYVFLSLTIK